MKVPLLIVAFALLVVAAVGMYTTNFMSYMGNDPETCNNCHVMDSVYSSWYHSGHRTWAVCNDCHTPHDFIPKYYVKAMSGYHHVSSFLLGNYPEAIRPKKSSKDVVQENCIRCHTATVEDITIGHPDAGRYCFDCHRNVAHGERGITIQPALVTDRHSILYSKESPSSP